VSGRTAGRLAAGLGVLSVVLFAGGVALDVAASISLSNRIVNLVIILVFSAVAAAIASRQPRNPIAWIFCGAAVGGGVTALADGYAHYWLEGKGAWKPLGELAAWLEDLGWIPLVLVPLTFLLLLFPDGRVLTRRWRSVAWCAGLGIAGAFVTTGLDARKLDDFPIDNPYGLGTSVLDPLMGLSVLLLLVALIGSPISLWLRFRRATVEQRQQIKWLLWAGGVAALTFAIAVPGMDLWGTAISNAAILVSVLGLAVATGVAIVRYRLYDVDVVINRTLVYGASTATLAGAYLGSVLLLQLALSPGSDLAVAGSTLAVAALVRPVRARVQAAVDRRFYRRRYDVQRTLEAFTTRLRDEVALDALSGALRGVVDDTMQPAHVSLWLKEPGR
jgi:hypothetical protein